MKALLVSVAFVAMALADSASGTKRGGDRMLAGPGMIGPAEPADELDATDRAEPADELGATDRGPVSEKIGGRGRNGTSAPAGAQEDDPQSEHAADGDDAAIAAGPHIRWKGRSGDDGAPAAQGDSAQARAPPASLPATRIHPGAA